MSSFRVKKNIYIQGVFSRFNLVWFRREIRLFPGDIIYFD